MNKNTTILFGAIAVIAVIAVVAGAYVSMSKPSQEWFSTQSVRSGTRSLAGGTTFQSKSATTKTTTDTSRGVPTSNWWDGDALPKSQCEFIGCPDITENKNNFFCTPWINNNDWSIVNTSPFFWHDSYIKVNSVSARILGDWYNACFISDWQNTLQFSLLRKWCTAINEPWRVGFECCPEWTEQAPNTPTAIGDSM
jgi:hypothetical protein